MKQLASLAYHHKAEAIFSTKLDGRKADLQKGVFWILARLGRISQHRFQQWSMFSRMRHVTAQLHCTSTCRFDNNELRFQFFSLLSTEIARESIIWAVRRRFTSDKDKSWRHHEAWLPSFSFVASISGENLFV